MTLKFTRLTIILLLLSGCVSKGPRDYSGAEIDPRVRAEQEGRLSIAEAAFVAGNYAQAESLFLEFQKQFPTSIFYQKSQFGLAQSIEAQERWSQAAQLYRQTIDATQATQPGIAAQAYFQLSFCYENLGDETRVLASLQDAQRLKAHLPVEIAEAEIPARLAASYSRMGRAQEAQVLFKEAQRGIERIRGQQNTAFSSDWLAKTYYQMGVLSTQQIHSENIQTVMDTLRMVQAFSLMSAEAAGEPWSGMASTGLMRSYRDLWNAVLQIPLNPSLESGAAQREQTERQDKFAGDLLIMINDLKSYRAPEPASESVQASELFIYLGYLEKSLQNHLYALKERNPLTTEGPTGRVRKK